jgi:peptidoglycan L-alanyl-D-glutamate endopeptidase CwlK
MTKQPFNPNIEALQAALGIVPKDGIRGPQTTLIVLSAADAGRLSVVKPVAKAEEARPLINPPDEDDIPESGDARLVGVHAVLVDIIRETSWRCPIPFTVIEGLRTPERQRQLVDSGASRTQNSRHLTGHAVDLWPLDPATGKALPSDAAFKAGSAAAKAASARLWADLRAIAALVKQIAKERGVMVEWGGDWGWDAPHFQLNRQAFPA